MHSYSSTIDYNSNWLDKALEQIRFNGFAIIKDVLTPEECQDCIEAAYIVKERIHAELGEDRLSMALNDGYCELRLILAYHDLFLDMLTRPEVAATVDALLSPTAILRFQNLEIIDPPNPGIPVARQLYFHQNTTRLHPGYVDSIDMLYAVSDTELDVVPGTHQHEDEPSMEFLDAFSTTIKLPAGHLFIMDSTLWHKENSGNVDHTRVSIGCQFTRSYFKPHFDYPRALGEDKIIKLPERVQNMLGWHTRIPTSLDEFYQPTEKRLYRPGQD